MSQHLAILQVLLPLLAAPLCLLAGRGRWVSLVFLAASAGALACAVLLLQQVAGEGVVRYALGGWPAPFGIEYVIDGANAFVLVLVSLIAVVVAVYAPPSIAAEIEAERHAAYYACLSLCLAGLLGIVATGDAFNVFVFLEISSLSSYALIALGRRRQALLAAFQYLILGTIGATFLLIGIGLLYALTGTLNMADLAARLPPLHDNRTLAAAYAFIALGLAVKMAVFPLHAWLPGAYGEAPSATSALLAATGTKVAIYAFLRFTYTIFGGDYALGVLPTASLALWLGALAMLVGSAVACLQADLKRLLAWSSVAQVGYIVAGIGAASATGLAAAYLHMFNHALIKCALFCVAGALLLRLGDTRIEALAGLARRMPGTFAAFGLAGLGLIGVPGTAGFVSKWVLVQALVEQQLWALVAAVLVSSLMAVVYIGRVVEVAWFRDAPAGAVGSPSDRPVAAVPVSMQVATWGLVFAIVVPGFDSSALAQYARLAVLALTGGGA